jgi:hypothetical protein
MFGQNWQKRTEIFILFFLIVLNVLEFFNWLPADIAYIEKIVSWSALAYLLYKIGISDILFGNRQIHIDLILIISYFLLIINKFVGYSQSAIGESRLLVPLFTLVIDNAIALEKIGFYIGCFLIIIVSFYITFVIEFKEPSFFHAIYGKGKSKRSLITLIEGIIVFLIVTGFFIIIFNLIMEWLTIALDSPIIVLAILFYLFKMHGYGRSMDKETVIYKISEAAEEFYKQFINLFHKKETIFLGISGMLVLHLLTDFGTYIIPYIFGVKEGLYFSQLGQGHMPIFQLLISDLGSVFTSIDKLSLIILYIFNIMAMLFFFLSPCFIWYILYSKKDIGIRNMYLALILTSMYIFLVSPIFTVKELDTKNILGVDIQTNSILQYNTNVTYTLIISAFLFIIAVMLGLIIKKAIVTLVTYCSLMFLGIYALKYFINLTQYYLASLQILFSQQSYFLVFFIIIFQLITFVFYLGGYLAFLHEIFKN